MIYFIRSGETVKIGWTQDAATLSRRIATLQTGSAHKLEVARVVEAERWAEAWFHGFFAGMRLAGEWFRFDASMLIVEPPRERPKRARRVTERKPHEHSGHMRDEIQSWRHRHGWSQTDAAARLGISARTVQAWERGEGPAQPSVLRLAMQRLDDLQDRPAA